MSGILATNPHSIAWVNVTIGDTAVAHLYAVNEGDEPFTITEISLQDGNAVFALNVLISLPYQLDPYATGLTDIATVSYTPADATTQTDDVFIACTAINGPLLVPLSGKGAGAGVKAISIEPSGWVFADTKSGQTDTKTFRLTSVGDTAVTITALALPGGFTESGTWPQTINPDAHYDVDISFAPNAVGLFAGDVGITSDVTTATTFHISGVGFAIDPVFVIAAGPSKLVFGMATPVHVVSVKTMDETNFNCEDAGWLKKTHLYPFPTQGEPFPSVTYEKLIARVAFHYYDKGLATVTVQGVSMRDEIAQDVLAIGTVGASGRIKLAWAALNVTDELVDIQFLTAVDAGPVEIIDYVVKYEPKGERNEE